MLPDGRSWYSEMSDEQGAAFSLRLTSRGRLCEEQTPFQKIEIFETTEFGNLMTIDGLVMLTSRDNFIYHEMLAHPALFTHPAPRNVLIIGGGDCGTLREVLRHPGVDLVQQVDIDEGVTRAAATYFPELCESNSDPRAELHFADGIEWVRRGERDRYDLIIVDSTDPVGPAEGLFGEEFFRDCLRILRPVGILVQQSESPLYHLELLQEIHRHMHRAGFNATRTLHFPQPVYPSGWWSCTLAGMGPLDSFREKDSASRPFTTRYYTPQIHQGALALPPFVQEALAMIRE